jgi:hypothetical protein
MPAAGKDHLFEHRRSVTPDVTSDVTPDVVHAVIRGVAHDVVGMPTVHCATVKATGPHPGIAAIPCRHTLP